MNQKPNSLKKTALVSALLIEITTGAQAATINVDGTTCTLADAITAANTDTATGGCTAGAGDDILEITPNSTQTFTTAPPDITTNVTINANNSTIERSSADFFIVLSSSGGGSLTLNDATVTGGQGDDVQNLGGGLSAYDATLNVNNSTITGNTGGAVRFIRGVTSTISNSVIDNNTGISGSTYYTGGVIANGGSIVIQNSTISNNTSDSVNAGGGGVYATGYSGALNLSIINTTISGNTSTIRGGGLGHVYYNNPSTINLTNVTIAANTSSGNGGGISNDTATITISQSLISGNTGTGGAELDSSGGTITVDDYNLFGFNSTSGVAGVTVGASDIVPAAAALTDIVDTNLTDNGGPTPTHALNPTGPAVDVIPSASCASATDQTGESRPIDGNVDGMADCDVGAFENRNPDIIFKNGFD